MLRFFARARRRLAGGLVVAIGSVACTAARAELVTYYVGVDDLSTITSGTYAGLPNPNHNRLTLLYAHHYDDAPASNHYHSKAIKVYTGANLGSATEVVTSTSDFMPEGSSPPIRLSPGVGAFAGKLVSNPYTDPADANFHVSDFQMKSTRSLAGFAAGTGETHLFGSSGGRWDSAFDDADLHLTLVSVTPGLKVGGPAALDIGLTAPGDELHLGTPDASLSFTPTFYTDAAAAPGIYEATFRLTDEASIFGSSGDFRFRLQVVPEPGTLVLIPAVAMALLARRRGRPMR